MGSNAGGTTFGNDKMFTTSGGVQAPSVTTTDATNVTSTSATLNGTIDPHGASTTFYFEYGTTTSYGSFTQQGSTSIAQNIGYDLTGLTPGTTYHYRLVGSNAGGTTFGNDKMFTTSGGVQAPSVTTTDATNVTSTSATLNGTIDPHGASRPFTSNMERPLHMVCSRNRVRPASLRTSAMILQVSLQARPITTDWWGAMPAEPLSATIKCLRPKVGQTHTVTVKSSNPNSGVSIGSSTPDNNGNAGGTTTFTRVFNLNANARYVAPSTASGNNFQKWQLDGSDLTTSTTAPVTMGTDHTLTAVYGASPTPSPVPIFLSLHSLRTDAFANVSGAAIDDPLLPRPDETFLGASQPTVTRGLVLTG